MAQPQALFAGHRLGSYELIREIGKGGFASVWLARWTGPDGSETLVALKLIRDDLTKDPDLAAMLRDESRLVAAIRHPNVVGVFELGEQAGTLYLAMEYVRGRPLSALRDLATYAKRKIPVAIVMRILADTCAGLHAAHELTRDGRPLGVVHRDVSPQNILVADDGWTKLIDFGVAKANERLAKPTAYGVAKGKLKYMAPEQAVSSVFDRRADVFAVGAVAYDLLEGHPPFHAPTDAQSAALILGTEPVPPFTVTLPPAIDRVIAKALARNPDQRFPTAAAMQDAIERALEASALGATTADVAAFFGAALRNGDEPSTEPSGSTALRARLVCRDDDETTTARMPRAATAVAQAPPEGTPTSIDIPLEVAPSERQPPPRKPPRPAPKARR
jgi:serine/threonine-protein kinase